MSSISVAEQRAGTASKLSLELEKEENTAALPQMVNDENVFASNENREMDESFSDKNAPIGITMRHFSIQSLKEAASELAASVDFFREYAPEIAEIEGFSYKTLPKYCTCDGMMDDQKEAARFEIRKRLVRDVTNFPFLQKRGRLQVPMALLCEAESHVEKILAIINYWRQLNASRQRELKASMQRFYVRPNVTNERLVLVSVPSKASASSSLEVSEGPLGNRGRVRRSVTPWGLRCLETCTQLAEAIGLCHPGENPKIACELLRTANLELPRSTCKTEDCVYPVLARNNGYCCRHGLHFGPTKGKIKGRRGYLLLGDVYTRPYVVSTTTDSKAKDTDASTGDCIKKLTTCSCRNETCVGIGYSPVMIQFDIHRFPKELQDSIWSDSEALNMTAKTHFQLSRNKHNDENDAEPSMRSTVLRLAPWHFHPEHRELLPDGSWKLLDTFHPSGRSESTPGGDCYTTTHKEWKGIPLPSYSPKDFLEEPIMKEYASRKEIVASTTDMLPSWCREYAKLEEGPSTISESQRNFLWDNSIMLENKLASEILSFRMKERVLESELERVRGKYNEKKFLKRRDKKRKRVNADNGRGSTSNRNRKNDKINSTNTSGKPSSSKTLQENNTSDMRNRAQKRQREQVDKTSQNSSDYSGVDRRTNEAGEPTNNIEHRESSSAMETAHRRNSLRMGSVHYSNHPRPEQPQPHHRQHHPYLHSYPQRLPHQRAHPNRPAPMDFRHPSPRYHHHPQQQPQQQEQQQSVPYPQQHNQHQQAFHHPRHDERANQYRERPPQEQHPAEVPPPQPQHDEQQRQQQQQQQQRPRHYPEQQNWQQGRYYN